MSLQGQARAWCKALRSPAGWVADMPAEARLSLIALIDALSGAAVDWQDRYIDEGNRLTNQLLDRKQREQRDGALAMLRGLEATVRTGTFDEVIRALDEARRFVVMADDNWFPVPPRQSKRVADVVPFKRRDA